VLEGLGSKLGELRDEVHAYIDAKFKRSDTQMLSNQINALKRELVDQIKQLNLTSKQPEPAAPAEPIDLPSFLRHKTTNQLN
jgi:hypothetical protein